MHNYITTYKAHEKRKMSIFKVISLIIRNVMAFKSFIYILFKRDFFMAYKRSLFGYAWLFFAPLFSAATWILMGKLGILRPNVSGVSFAAYILTGMNMWLFFMDVYKQVSNAFVSNKALMTKIKYPHEILIFSQTLKASMNFLIAYLVNLVIITFLFNVSPNFYWLIAPFYLIPLVMLAIGLGSIFMVVKFTMPDVEKTFSFLLPMLMFTTPIIYAISDDRGSKLWNLVKMNPLTYLIGYPKDLMLYGQSDFLTGFTYSAIGSIVFCVWAINIFFVSEEILVEKIY